MTKEAFFDIISSELKEKPITKYIRKNRQIRAGQVKLISSTGEMLGTIDTALALKKAEEEGLDLVEVSPNVYPPITKIMDWGKYKYELSKKEGKAKTVELKTLRLSAKIGGHDLEVKANKAINFLEKGQKVKAQLMFRGREIANKEIGERVLVDFTKKLEEFSDIEQDLKSMGREMSIIYKPKKIKT